MNSRSIVATAVAVGVIAGAAAGLWFALTQRIPKHCEIDTRPIHGNMRTLVKVDGKRLHACCARCPLTLVRQEGLPVEILEVTDYLSCRRVPASQAYYVEGSRIEMCSSPRLSRAEGITPYARLFDRCAPSLLAFVREDEARAFTSIHGGSLKRLEELMTEARGGKQK